MVRKGETLYSISVRYDQNYRTLARLNRISPPYVLRVGQSLVVRPAPQVSAPVQRNPWAIQRIPTPLSWRRRLQHGRWLWPLQGHVVTHFFPTQGKKGIDIAGHARDSIKASAAGVVAYAGRGLTGYDYLIIIKHPKSYLTTYGHNLRNLVHEGQTVRAGQVIAEIGLIERRYWGVHFEIRHDGRPVNPMEYLS